MFWNDPCPFSFGPVMNGEVILGHVCYTVPMFITQLFQVVNSHLVCDPTIRQPGFDFPRQQWSLMNRFHTEQGKCGACRRKWRFADTDLCHPGDVPHCRILSVL